MDEKCLTRVYERIYIALGSNIGDRESWLRKAIQKLREVPGVRTVRCSSIYETEPVGYTDQGRFLNMAAALDTTLPIGELFRHMMRIEQELGRTRDVHWGPRTIDLDLIIADRLDNRIETKDLVVPHPRMAERAFVLIPLLDVLERQHPDHGAVLGMLRSLPNREGVELWRTRQSLDESEHFAN